MTPGSNLFDCRGFVGSSGDPLPWKVDCDSLSVEDWFWAAARVAERYSFQRVFSVPTGGDNFAAALESLCRPDGEVLLFVDDVWTTGRSMRTKINEYVGQFPGVSRRGVVLFARAPIPEPSMVDAIWSIW